MYINENICYRTIRLRHTFFLIITNCMLETLVIVFISEDLFLLQYIPVM